MKSVLYLLLAIGSVAQAQTFVSTEPTKRNVLLEEITGRHCNHCPEGHATVVRLTKKYPQRIYPSEVYAEPMIQADKYDCAAGDSLIKLGLEGSPSAFINRGEDINHEGSDKAWEEAVVQQLNETSPVNVAARCTLDYATRKLRVQTEVYYTANGTGTTNNLFVVILQNELISKDGGIQQGMYHNPDWIIGTDNPDYRHRHVLRAIEPMIWGEAISPLTAGTLIQRTIEIDLPTLVGDVPLVMEDLHILVGVSQNKKKVETVVPAEIVRVNTIEQSARILCADNQHPAFPKEAGRINLTIYNNGTVPISSIDFEYSWDNTVRTFQWKAKQGKGSIPVNEVDTLNIDGFEMALNTPLPCHIQITKINGVDVKSKTKVLNKELIKQLYTTLGDLTFDLSVDQYGSEVTFKLFSPDGKVFLKGGPWEDDEDINVTLHSFSVKPTQKGVYILEVYDSGYNGICCRFGSGHFEMRKGETNVFRNEGNYVYLAKYYFEITEITGIDDVKKIPIAIYPSPVIDRLYLDNPENITIDQLQLSDCTGKIIFESGRLTNSSIDVSSLFSGVYFLKLSIGQETKILKFIK